MPDRETHARNRAAWNIATRRHNAHKHDQAGFLRGGGSTLFAEELDMLGDLAGQRVAHLCCNAGQDTLSLVHHGAKVTGVDISDEAIAFAQQLSADSGLPGTFHRADVYDWLAEAPTASFDRVFFSYGALDWLSDLDLLMAGVRRILAPGGRVAVVEFHALAFSMSHDGRLIDAYFSPPRTDEQGLSDYVGDAAGGLSPMGAVDVDLPPLQTGPITYHCYTPFQILNAVAGSGLNLRRVAEWAYTNGWRPFPEARPLPGRRWTWPEGQLALPLMYGFYAEVGG